MINGWRHVIDLMEITREADSFHELQTKLSMLQTDLTWLHYGGAWIDSIQGTLIVIETENPRLAKQFNMEEGMISERSYLSEDQKRDRTRTLISGSDKERLQSSL